MVKLRSYDKEMAKQIEANPELGKSLLKAAIRDGDIISVDQVVRQIQVAQKDPNVLPYRSNRELETLTFAQLQDQLADIDATLDVREMTEQEKQTYEQRQKDNARADTQVSASAVPTEAPVEAPPVESPMPEVEAEPAEAPVEAAADEPEDTADEPEAEADQ